MKTSADDENNDQVWAWNRTKKEWLSLVNSVVGIIILVALAHKCADDCAIIPTQRYMVLFFGLVYTYSCLIKFIQRTERLKRQGEQTNEWVNLDRMLELGLIEIACWGFQTEIRREMNQVNGTAAAHSFIPE